MPLPIFDTELQIISDLHLETPLAKPSYYRDLEIYASNLLLLGDIGLIRDQGLYNWFNKLLTIRLDQRIFYVLGNHEPWGMALPQAISTVEAWAEKLGPRFIFLKRRRYNISSTATILGCTLWSHIPAEYANEVHARSSDFKPDTGLRNWTIEAHNAEHKRDLAFLNEQVAQIEREEPQRHIVVATHHSPTLDERANNPRYPTNEMTCNFVTDLRAEPCYTSPAVRMWAFGHTHYSCQYHDEHGKLVIAHQHGYNKIEQPRGPYAEAKVVTVSLGDQPWTVEPKRLENSPGRKRGTGLGTKLKVPAQAPLGTSPQLTRTRQAQMEGTRQRSVEREGGIAGFLKRMLERL